MIQIDTELSLEYPVFMAIELINLAYCLCHFQGVMVSLLTPEISLFQVEFVI
jgi:hypothetical protein